MMGSVFRVPISVIKYKRLTHTISLTNRQFNGQFLGYFIVF